MKGPFAGIEKDLLNEVLARSNSFLFRALVTVRNQQQSHISE